MKFEQFNQLALGDPLMLMTALELLLQSGRGVIQSRQTSDLVSGCQASLGALFTENKLCEIVNVRQKLAGLETRTLVDYLHRGDLEIKDPGADEAGTTWCQFRRHCRYRTSRHLQQCCIHQG